MHTFAPLQPQYFGKESVLKINDLRAMSANILYLLQRSASFYQVSKIRLDNLVDIENAEKRVRLAKIGADRAENDRHFANNLPKIVNYPTATTTVAAAALSAGTAPDRFRVALDDPPAARWREVVRHIRPASRLYI